MEGMMITEEMIRRQRTKRKTMMTMTKEEDFWNQ
jgi:hypothetical protein